jgi:hypothetical protein
MGMLNITMCWFSSSLVSSKNAQVYYSMENSTDAMRKAWYGTPTPKIQMA